MQWESPFKNQVVAFPVLQLFEMTNLGVEQFGTEELMVIEQQETINPFHFIHTQLHRASKATQNDCTISLEDDSGRSLMDRLDGVLGRQYLLDEAVGEIIDHHPDYPTSAALLMDCLERETQQNPHH